MNNQILSRVRRGRLLAVLAAMLIVSITVLATGARENALPAWQEPRLIKNILSQTEDSNIYPAAEMNGQLFFFAMHQGIDRDLSELWRTDGTPGGTILLEQTSAETSFVPMFVLGDKLLFLAPHPDYGMELWISDGTPGNAHVMGDAFPAPWDGNVAGHTVSGDYLYFTAYDDVNFTELWRTDGTLAGTIRLTGADLLGQEIMVTGTMIDVEGTLFCVAVTLEGQPLLLKSDGTPATTTIVKEGDGSAFSGPMHAANGLLIIMGREIWRSDGTDAGTYVIHTFSDDRGIPEFGSAAAETKVYFVVVDNNYDYELWQTMGTAGTTTKIADLPGFYARMATVGDRLFFIGVDQEHGNELWTSDGTPAGTKLVKDILPGTNGINPDRLIAAGDQVFFAVDSATQYGELWRSDGTTAGTVQVSVSGASVSGPMASPLAPLGDELFFQADDDTHGREPWMTTGGGASAVFLKDINAIDALGSSPGGFNYVNDTLFFFTPAGLWQSDGSAMGTSLLVENVPQQRTVRGYPTGISSNKFYFLIDDHSTNTLELWRSDGTTGGTIHLLDMGETNRPDPFHSPADVNGLLYFANKERQELWRSDGTPGGTVFVATTTPTPEYAAKIDEITGLGSTAFFVANDHVHGPALWRSDGTTAGTVMVKDIDPTPDVNIAPSQLTAAGGFLYFMADDRVHGAEVWRSDGTTAGTLLPLDVRPGVDSSEPAELTAFRGKLYFAADDGTHGRELWRSDGSAGGTVMVKDSPTPGGPLSPSELTPGEDWLFYLAADETGLQPWKTDGTAAGTGRITALTYQDFFYPQSLVAVGNVLLFGVGNNSSIDTLYQSDGTAAGTVNLNEEFPDFTAYNYNVLTAGPGRLFFSATHLLHGNEPFMKLVSLTRQTPAMLYLGEGDTFSYYQFRLTFRPAAPVTVTFTSDDPTVEFVPASVTIQPGNWGTPVAIGVRAADDDQPGTRAATIRQTLASADSTIDGAVTTMPINIGWRFVYAPVVRR